MGTLFDQSPREHRNITTEDRESEPKEMEEAKEKKLFLVVDYENNSEIWWDNARSNKNFSSKIRNWMHSNEDSIQVTDKEAKHFLEIARKIPGWNSGPKHARNPILINDESEEME